MGADAVSADHIFCCVFLYLFGLYWAAAIGLATIHSANPDDMKSYCAGIAVRVVFWPMTIIAFLIEGIVSIMSEGWRR